MRKKQPRRIGGHSAGLNHETKDKEVKVSWSDLMVSSPGKIIKKINQIAIIFSLSAKFTFRRSWFIKTA
jgi:hypothetical protein